MLSTTGVKQLGQVALLLGAALSAGCSNDRLPTYPVRGRVVFPDGSPVKTGSIELRSRQHRVHARGDIDKNGFFRLTTYDENDGAVEGGHECVVVQLVMVEELKNFDPSTDGVVDPRFGSYTTSGLECHVSSKEDNDVTLTVRPLVSTRTTDAKPVSSLHGHSHKHGHEHGHDHRTEAE